MEDAAPFERLGGAAWPGIDDVQRSGEMTAQAFYRTVMKASGDHRREQGRCGTRHNPDRDGFGWRHGLPQTDWNI
jgi:hypothetical protein